MKSIIKVYQINKQENVIDIHDALAKIEGIIACEISLEKKEIQVIYNESFVNLEVIIENIENLGYIVT